MQPYETEQKRETSGATAQSVSFLFVSLADRENSEDRNGQCTIFNIFGAKNEAKYGAIEIQNGGRVLLCSFVHK